MVGADEEKSCTCITNEEVYCTLFADEWSLDDLTCSDSIKILYWTSKLECDQILEQVLIVL